MISISSDNEALRSFKIDRHISEAALCTRIENKAKALGIPVRALQEKLKVGGFLSSAEDCVLVSNTQKKGYEKMVIYQKSQGAYCFLYMYAIGVSSNLRRDIIHNALYTKNANDAREGGWGTLGAKAFGAIGSAIVPKANKKAKIEEEEYYQIIIEIIEGAINELLTEPQTSYSTTVNTPNNNANTYNNKSTQTYNNTHKAQTTTTNYNATSSTRQSGIDYSRARGEKTYINANRNNYSTADNAKQTNTANYTNNKAQAKPNTTNNIVNNSQPAASNENSGGCLSVIFAFALWGAFGMILAAIGTNLGIHPAVIAVVYIIGSIIYLNRDGK